jgi:hypothetical protein
MDPNEVTVMCNNCKTMVLQSKMVLHEAYCIKNIRYCAICAKGINVNEFEEHMKLHNAELSKQTQENKKPKRNCKCQKHGHSDNKDNEVKQPPKAVIVPGKRKVHIDESFGLKKCEYCDNVFEDIENHYLECESKKFIEEQQALYYKELKERDLKDQRMASQLSKIKEMDTDKDVAIAQKLQKELEKNKIMDTDKDVAIAQKLQRELNKNKIMDTDKDIEYARKLQNELNKHKIMDTDKDVALAQKLQREFNKNKIMDTDKDIDYARRLQNELNKNKIMDTNNDVEYARRLQNENNNNYDY